MTRLGYYDSVPNLSVQLDYAFDRKLRSLRYEKTTDYSKKTFSTTLLVKAI